MLKTKIKTDLNSEFPKHSSKLGLDIPNNSFLFHPLLSQRSTDRWMDEQCQTCPLIKRCDILHLKIVATMKLASTSNATIETRKLLHMDTPQVTLGIKENTFQSFTVFTSIHEEAASQSSSKKSWEKKPFTVTFS